jgi:hypothetical protein
LDRARHAAQGQETGKEQTADDNREDHRRQCHSFQQRLTKAQGADAALTYYGHDEGHQRANRTGFRRRKDAQI